MHMSPETGDVVFDEDASWEWDEQADAHPA
jgi:hypothetical protein